MDRTRDGRVEDRVADRVSDPFGHELRDGLLRGDVTAFEAPLLAVYRGPVRPKTGAIAAATAAWFALVFGLCYLALPALADLLGLYHPSWSALSLSVIGFGSTAFVTVVGAALARPALSATTRDPVLAATLGGLLTWAVIQNSSAVLRPFSAMSAVELGTFFALNVLEMFLIGSMLASLTRWRLAAFALGTGWQLVSTGLYLTLFYLLRQL